MRLNLRRVRPLARGGQYLAAQRPPLQAANEGGTTGARLSSFVKRLVWRGSCRGHSRARGGAGAFFCVQKLGTPWS
jgi:hypothetical protein